MVEATKRPEAKIFHPAAFEEVQASSPVATNNSENLNYEIKEVTALYNLGVAVGSTLNFKKVIWALYKETGRLIDTSNFAIIIYDEPTDTLNFILVMRRGKSIKPFSLKLSNSEGVTKKVLTTQAPLLIRDLVGTNNRFEVEKIRPDQQTQSAARPSVRSWLGVPILNPALSDEVAQGVIAVWSDQPHAFTDHELWLLSAIGTQAAIAIRNAQLFEASQRRATEMALLHEESQRRAATLAMLDDIARALSATLHLDEVLTRIMERINEMLKVEVGYLLLSDPPTGDLVFQIALGERAQVIKPFRVSKGQGIAGEVALTGKPLMITEADRDKPSFNQSGEKISFSGRNVLCVPLILHEHVIGVLQVMNKLEGDFTQNNLELLNSIASYAAIAIKNARLHEHVLAERDRVIEAEEQARKELARDLHDGATQLISSVMMRLDFIKLLAEREPAKLIEEINLTQELAEQSVHEVRTLLFELRPLVLEMQGLSDALRIFLERRQKDVEGTTKLTLDVKTINTDGKVSRLNTKVERAIFAIVQESVNNALKHAQAKNIKVHLKEAPTAIRAIVIDDGIGFDVDKVMNNYERRESLGMINIKERTDLIGGELSLNSTLGKGTHISLFVPKAEKERLKKRGTGSLSLPLDMPPRGQAY